MPIARLALILVAVIAAAAATVALGALVSVALGMPAVGLPIAIPVALAAFLLVRVIGGRLRTGGSRRIG